MAIEALVLLWLSVALCAALVWALYEHDRKRYYRQQVVNKDKTINELQSLNQLSTAMYMDMQSKNRRFFIEYQHLIAVVKGRLLIDKGLNEVDEIERSTGIKFKVRELDNDLRADYSALYFTQMKELEEKIKLQAYEKAY